MRLEFIRKTDREPIPWASTSYRMNETYCVPEGSGWMIPATIVNPSEWGHDVHFMDENGGPIATVYCGRSGRAIEVPEKAVLFRLEQDEPAAMAPTEEPVDAGGNNGGGEMRILFFDKPWDGSPRWTEDSAAVDTPIQIPVGCYVLEVHRGDGDGPTCPTILFQGCKPDPRRRDYTGTYGTQWFIPAGATHVVLLGVLGEALRTSEQQTTTEPIAVEMNLECLRGELVYIAGPYRPTNGRAVIENIRVAEYTAILLAKAGVFFFCPHMNSRHLDGVASDEFFLELDRRILRDCDVLLAIDGWEKSEGARIEVELAQALRIPVYELVYNGTIKPMDGPENKNKAKEES